jgi:hypothetical protein
MSFKNWLKQNINEIKSLSGVDPERDLLFNNVFGDKLRLTIPLDSNTELHKLVGLLQNLGYSVDYEDLINKKIVYKNIKTKEGEKKRPEKVGKALQTAISFKSDSSSEAESLLDWWQKNSASLKNSQTGASIIISRSPIDLVRMSDHDNITSCHNPKRSHFKCAKQEARTGGAIAYVVKNSDLVGLDIQKKEIFQDKERKIKGIVPLERLRLRRFRSRWGDIDLLLPELSTYGTNHIGFYDAVKNWAKSAQADIIKDINPEEDYEDFNLKGGTYQDTNADEIWGDFFGTKYYGKRKTSEDEEEERKDSTNGDDLHEDAENQIREHSANWKHFNVYHDVIDDFDGDGGAYLSYNASVSFIIPIRETTEKFEKARGSWRDGRELDNIISRSIDMYHITDINWDYSKEDKNLIANLSIDHEERSSGNQLDNLEQFLDYIDDLDSNYEAHIQNVYAKLIEKGYMKSPTVNFKFKNFEVEIDDEEGDVTMDSKPEKIGYLKDFAVEIKSTGYPDHGFRLDELKDKIFNDASITSIPFIDQKNIVLYMLRNNTQGWYHADDKTDNYGVPINGKEKILTGYVYIKFSKSFKHLDNKNKTKVISQLKQLDKNWDFYTKRLSQIFDLTVKREIEKRNKMFAVVSNIPKVKSTQKRINFEDFVKKNDKV